ncbi:ferredoxin [Mitsuokella sp.]|uniref:ferredoxin n=1 Tax=Mitsuokella TaxID=52225 RepID=UPI0029E7B933|nr:ferredoxin [Mitsuokella sp.]MDD6383414.1 ferredoxin [Selenomonadaceae bacterium]MDY4475469.1 ferredoxin [Mitsuokella sp.]
MVSYVNEMLCVACGMCAAACPEGFSMEGNMAKGGREIPAACLDDAWQVMEDCPAGAIELHEQK